MRLKKLFGLEKEDITDDEITAIIRKAKKEGKNSVTIKGLTIKFKKNQYGECGILD